MTALDPEERSRLRLLLDEARRERMRLRARAHEQVELCLAHALNGRACRNLRGPDGYCKLHRRLAQTALVASGATTTERGI